MKMKKWLVPLLIAVLCLSALTGCGKKEDPDSGKKSDKSEKKETAQEAEQPAQFESKSFEIGSFTVTYTGHELMKDVNGKDCIAVHYSFTNNSTTPTNFFWNIYDTMMQNGKELVGAYIYTNDNLDLTTDSTVKDVEQGKSLDVTTTYILTDLSAPVQISLSDLTDSVSHTFEISIQGMPVAEAFVPESLDQNLLAENIAAEAEAALDNASQDASADDTQSAEDSENAEE